MGQVQLAAPRWTCSGVRQHFGTGLPHAARTLLPGQEAQSRMCSKLQSAMPASRSGLNIMICPARSRCNAAGGVCCSKCAGPAGGAATIPGEAPTARCTIAAHCTQATAEPHPLWLSGAPHEAWPSNKLPRASQLPCKGICTASLNGARRAQCWHRPSLLLFRRAHCLGERHNMPGGFKERLQAAKRA